MNESSLQAGTATRFFRNAVSLLTSDVLNKATTFLVYALVGRMLDLTAFGQLSLGLTIFYVFQVLATAGLPSLLTREIAKRPGRTNHLISSGLVTIAVAAMVAMFSMQLLTIGLQYSSEMTWLLFILSLGLVPYAGALVVEASFRGNERMHYIAFSNVLANVIKVGGALAILFSGLGVLWIAGLIVCVRWVIFLSDVSCYRFLGGWSFVRPSRGRVMALLGKASAFLGIDVVIACWGAVDGVLLSKLMTESEVGLFCAAGQLLQPVALVYRSIVASVFPAMCRKARVSQNLHVMTRWMVAFLMLIGLPVTILLASFSDLILYLVYGDPQFQGAVPVMRIAAFGLIAHSFTSILGHALWASGREKDTLRIVLINFAMNILISYLFISWWGLLGAPIASLCVVIFNVWQHFDALHRVTRERPVDSQVIVPLAAAGGMLLVLVLLTPVNRYVAAVCATSVYFFVAGGLLLGQHGGPQKLRSGFFSPLAQ